MRDLVFLISFCIDWFKRCKNLLLCLEIFNIVNAFSFACVVLGVGDGYLICGKSSFSSS